MKCRYNKVTCDRSLYSYLSSLAISNLTYHDNIRVLTKDRSKC